MVWARKKAPAGTDGRSASAVSRGQSGARTAPAQDAPARAGARTRETRAKQGPAAGRPAETELERKDGVMPDRTTDYVPHAWRT